nr:glycoside hydrolase family 3 protein [Microlunatus panaciterrae]
MASLSTEEKIGQIIATSVGHHAVDQVNAAGASSDLAAAGAITAGVLRTAEEIAEFHLGGVCYFPSRPDGQLPGEVAEITARLQQAAPIPLLVSTDQEGGRVARLRRGFSLFPSAMALAAIGDPAVARQVARTSAEEMRAVGINHVFAPDADVNSNPANPVIGTRSFGADPERTAEFVVEMIAGYREGGVASTVKHFPGHGDTATDSHLGVPVLERSERDWRAVDLPPFQAALRAGVDTVMGGHLVLRFAGPEPATYAYPIMTTILRDELGFEGLVVSDALEMEGAVAGRDPDEAVVDALLAGIDQLLMPRSTAGAVAALRRAAADGRLPIARLDQACLRVLRLKESLGLLTPPQQAARGVVVGRQQPAAVDLARRAVTVIGTVRTLPVGTNVLLVADPALVEDLRLGLMDRGLWVTVAGADRWSDPQELASRAPGFDAVLVVCNDAWKNPEQNPPVAELLAELPDALLVAVGTPYDAALADGRHSAWLTYGFNQTQALGLAIALTDPERPPAGSLPVPLQDQAVSGPAV